MSDSTMTIDEYGTKIWRNSKGEWHRTDGPAVMTRGGGKAWYVNGKVHRTDGPAVITAEGMKAWYLNDKLHRTDGPAIEWLDGRKEWWIDGTNLTVEEFLKNDLVRAKTKKEDKVEPKPDEPALSTAKKVETKQGRAKNSKVLEKKSDTIITDSLPKEKAGQQTVSEDNAPPSSFQPAKVTEFNKEKESVVEADSHSSSIEEKMIWTHTLTSIAIIILFVKVISSSQNRKLIVFLRDLQLPLAISFSLGTLALTFMDLKDDSLIEESIFPIMAFKMIHIVIGSIMSVLSDFIFAISKDFKSNEDQTIE